jgi:hypothetical protein
MKRRTLIVSAILLAAFSMSSNAGAAEPEWHSEQPVAAGINVPVPLGTVGGMAFWSANKGVLVTAGTGGTPAGVYAYDGSSWYLYSTVCGGHGGGIAISGPDEFWTIADYGEPQEGIEGSQTREWGRTLCHFANGEVVASYAEPAASAEAFQKLNAAACAGPANCWFAGEPLPSTAANQDPFHLHWDGGSLNAVPSPIVSEPEVTPMGGSVESLAFAQGRLFESASEAPYLREVSLGDPRRFLPIEPLTVTSGPFVLSSEPLEQQLWAGSEAGVLRLGATGFESVPTPSPILETPAIRAIGVEPGTEAAWLGGGGAAGAEVRRVTADGTLGPIVHLPQSSERLNPKEGAERIVCPAVNQCWMTTHTGWLFHLGGAPPEGVNTDPLMHRLITSRPKDASSRTFVPAGLPEDNSGEIETNKSGGEEPLKPFPESRPRRSIVYAVHQKMIGKLVLQLSFKLRARAHVQLLAKYHKEVVAKTPRLTLGKGPHQLRLKLDPKRWPTGLDFPVHAVGKRPAK